MINDVEAGADLYCFAQDQFARLITASALAKLGQGAAKTVIETNDADAVAAVTTGEDTLWAYPLTADNGYFMYYDKSVIPDEDVDSLEKLIADCEAANKYFSFELNAWYLASFFFGAGCKSEWITDNDGNITGVNDNFNSDKGLVAAKAMNKLLGSSCYNSSSEASAFEKGSAIVVSGTWNSATIRTMLGDNMGVADLPSFEVDGETYHLGSYFGFKLMGVKPQVDAVKGAALHRLAQYLTGYDCQMERHASNGWGPSNLQAQAEDVVVNDPVLIVVNEQRQYSVIQGAIHGSWWDIGKVIGDEVKAATSEEDLKQALQNYEDKMVAVFNMSNDEKEAWTVIGTCNLTDGFFYTDYNNETRSNWTDDIPMVKGEDGLWRTEKAWEMEAGTEFKVRQGKSWDVSWGNGTDNFKVEEAGTYYVVFDEAAATVSLEAAE